MSIVTYPLNDVGYSAEDAEIYNCVRTSGVFAAKDNLDMSLTGDREITISPGIAWIKNKQFAGKAVAVTEPVTVTIDAADDSLYRVDRIVLRFSAEKNKSEIAVKKGEASLALTPPDVERTETVYELALYDVAVYPGRAVLEKNTIADRRHDSAVCGIVSSGVDISHIIDTEMSDESWNAVQNRVIKSYIDREISLLRSEIDALKKQIGN